MKHLEVFNYRGYGDYGCSKCKAPLVGYFTAIGEVSDEAGYEWRSFCPKCAKELGIADNYEVTPHIQELYNTYPDAPFLRD